ncbi:MAG: fatty acid desaturase [Phycisphaerales bacterium]|nr:fatty acid desaturase [Phycisphaerales bacterium]
MESITQIENSATSVSVGRKIGTFVGVIAPFVGLLVAGYGFWGWGFSWIDLAILLVMYTVTLIGITIGFHRLFTHRSFETIRPIKFLLAVFGSMAVQGPLLRWVATHRRHHQHSDQADDPHSPHRCGGGLLGVCSGWWHAHIGWMFKSDAPGLERYVRDLKKDGVLRHVSRLFGLWVALGLVIPAVVGGLMTGTWLGALLGFLWGGLVRVFLVHHVTWSINSICHLWGTRPFQSRDESRNNVVCGLLAFGEGWHNNHHAFPTSARHGLRWWQLDLSYLVICMMKWLGLAWDVRVPARERIRVKPS